MHRSKVNTPVNTPPLNARLNLQPSIMLFCFWIFSHSLALIAIFYLIGYVSYYFIWFALALLVYCVWAFRDFYHRYYVDPIMYVKKLKTGSWELGSMHQKQLIQLRRYYRTPWLVILHYRSVDRGVNADLVIFKDALSADDYKTLLIGLWPG